MVTFMECTTLDPRVRSHQMHLVTRLPRRPRRLRRPRPLPPLKSRLERPHHQQKMDRLVQDIGRGVANKEVHFLDLYVGQLTAPTVLQTPLSIVTMIWLRIESSRARTSIARLNPVVLFGFWLWKLETLLLSNTFSTEARIFINSSMALMLFKLQLSMTTIKSSSCFLMWASHPKLRDGGVFLQEHLDLWDW